MLSERDDLMAVAPLFDEHAASTRASFEIIHLL